MKYSHLLITALLFPLATACDAPLSLTSRPADSAAAVTTVRATLQTGASGQQLQVAEMTSLPAEVRNAREIRAVFDNSTTTYTVVRNADTSLTIPLPAGRSPNSSGIIEGLLTTDLPSTHLIHFDTGALLKFGNPAIRVSPSAQVVQGARLSLSANFTNPEAASAYDFNWFVGSSALGPWTPVSGRAATTTWEPARAGGYFVRLDTVDRRTLASTTYTSPVPLVLVQDSSAIAVTTPANGNVTLGERIELKANIPGAPAEARYLWAAAQSPQGPFAPIAETGATIRWEPTAAGSYYLRLQTVNGDNQTSTYTSSKALVFVAEAEDIIQTAPASGSLTRGQSIDLSTRLEAREGLRLSWSYALSAQGPFTSIPNGEGDQVRWTPQQTGEFFLRVRAFDSASGEERTYTSSRAVVVVSDSDTTFSLSPSPAAVVRGESVRLRLNQELPNGRTIAWQYAASPQGPFQAIPGQGQDVNWSPSQAGSFYLRAEVSGGSLPTATYTSASALVTVSESGNVIQVLPGGATTLGYRLQLRANVPNANERMTYNWAYGLSPVGPWLSAQSLSESVTGPILDWTPTEAGSFYLKVDVSTPDSRDVLSFTTPAAAAFVNEGQPFFRTSPSPANITTNSAVSLSVNYTPAESESVIYAWSAGPSPNGPFTAIGGSLVPQITWQRPGVQGNYHLKVDVISNRTQRALSFVSPTPLVFVGASQ